MLVFAVLAVLVWQHYGLKENDSGLVSGKGRIEAVEIDIAARSSARVKDILVREGEFVTAGQVVATMDTETLETASEQEKLIFRIRAQIPVELLNKNITRVKTGLPGMAYLQLDHNKPWPEHLLVMPVTPFEIMAGKVWAMSSHCPYRPSLGIPVALDEIRAGRGTRYHTPNVDACLNLILEKELELSSAEEEEDRGLI